MIISNVAAPNSVFHIGGLRCPRFHHFHWNSSGTFLVTWHSQADLSKDCLQKLEPAACSSGSIGAFGLQLFY